jgi:serine/threonine protein phosphatase PrpC
MAFLRRFSQRLRAGRRSSSPSSSQGSGSIPGAGPVHHILMGAAQSAGLERDHNEDALFTMLGTSDGEGALPDFGLFIVADGMGGHISGEVASALSVRAVAHFLTQQHLLRVLDPSPREEAYPLHEIVRQALEEANELVVQNAPGSGTTLTLALLLGDLLTIGHVGDSRVYVISNNHIQPITKDHSFVERLIELGHLTAEEAASHPQRNVLYRAIGQGENLEVDVFTHPVPNDGNLLICSDGLWGVVPDKKIAKIISKAKNPQEACDALVRAAIQAGGPDNITAILLRFPPG